jgi:hypothetical protein
MTEGVNAWRLAIYGPEREQSGDVTEVTVGCDLSAADMALLPIGTTVEMKIVAKRREIVEQ